MGGLAMMRQGESRRAFVDEPAGLPQYSRQFGTTAPVQPWGLQAGQMHIAPTFWASLAGPESHAWTLVKTRRAGFSKLLHMSNGGGLDIRAAQLPVC